MLSDRFHRTVTWGTGSWDSRRVGPFNLCWKELRRSWTSWRGGDVAPSVRPILRVHGVADRATSPMEQAPPYIEVLYGIIMYYNVL